MKGVEWCGDSLETFRGFPEEVHDYLGDALHRVQHGAWTACANPLTGVGQGVCELRQRYRRVAYRLAYVARFESAVYVLHCFRKDAGEGIRTRGREIDLIRRRYGEVLRRLGLQ